MLRMPISRKELESGKFYTLHVSVLHLVISYNIKIKKSPKMFVNIFLETG